MLDALDTFTHDGNSEVLKASLGILKMSSRDFTLGFLQNLTNTMVVDYYIRWY